ncbi:MAG: hypothetical protein ACP6IY_08810 [Promethearchaeia archaeon]
MESSYKNALKQMISFLEKLEEKKYLKYYLVGGILANLYSDFRITLDIDVVIDLNLNNINLSEYINLMKKNDFNPIQDWNSTLILAKESKIIQILDKNEIIKFDLHVIDKYSIDKYKRVGIIALKNRLRKKLFGIECWIQSKEDFIISKLVFGGWQDYADALGCWLRFREELDIQYLEEISNKLNIKKEWNLLQSGIDDPDDFFEALNIE